MGGINTRKFTGTLAKKFSPHKYQTVSRIFRFQLIKRGHES